MLIHPAASRVPNSAECVGLGGGDGLAVRELLKWSSIQRITLVDLDAKVLDLARAGPLVSLNEGPTQ